MKKYIYLVLGLVLLFLSTLFIIYESNKYPDNFLYDFGGYYKNNQILTMYESNHQIYALVRNNEITVDAWDDDVCIDDMLNIAIIDQSFNLIELVEIVETQTLENDGDGIRKTEFEMSSYQDGDQIYISISLYDENYMVIFDTLTNTYKLNDMDMFLQSFIIEDETIMGVSSEYDHFSDMYEITYYEISKSLDVEHEAFIGHMNHVYRKPLVNSRYIFIQGDVQSKIFSQKSISRYHIATQQLEIIEHDQAALIKFEYMNQDTIIYSIHRVDSENFIIDYYHEDGSLLESFVNENYVITSIDDSRFISIHRELDYQRKIIRILDQEDQADIVLEFKQRVVLYEMYQFNDSVYFAVDLIETCLNKLFYGAHQTYIIKYSIEELDRFK